jgi:uncharacterized membrane protein
MTLQDFIKFIIYIHVITGTLAMIAGTVSMIAKKGGKIHKKSGLVFFYSLLISDVISLFVSVMPEHESPFLFCIGVFTLYLIVGGYLVLRYKQQTVNLFWDKILSTTMLITGIGMILYPIIQFGKFNIVLGVFGIVGIIMSFIDFARYRNKTKLREQYLQLHLSKMIGGFIASVTAFIVANGVISGLIGWLSPGAIGIMVIAYWTIKLNRKRKSVQ